MLDMMIFKAEFAQKAKFALGNGWRFLSGAWLDTSVDVDRMCTIFGVRFSGAHHHLTETIKQYQRDPWIDYRDTQLFKFHKSFQPTSTQDAMCLDAAGEHLDLFLYPWGTFRKSQIKSEKRAQYSRFCGPSTDKFIEEGFDRMTALYRQIRDLSYRPYTYPHSFVGGVWLLSKDKEKVFVVLQGNHRVAALVCCGIQKIDVRPIRKHLWTIKEENLMEWPLVKTRICSPKFASEVLNAFFRDNGPQICKRLNSC